MCRAGITMEVLTAKIFILFNIEDISLALFPLIGITIPFYMVIRMMKNLKREIKCRETARRKSIFDSNKESKEGKQRS